MATPESPKRKRSTRAAAEARASRIASSVIEAKPLADVAREEGISREHASRLANSPTIRLEIATLLDARRELALPLVERALGVIAESFEAEKSVVVQTVTHEDGPEGKRVTRSSDVVKLGPDHFVRLTGVKRLIELTTAGRSLPKEIPPAERGITLEEMHRWAEDYLRRQKAA